MLLRRRPRKVNDLYHYCILNLTEVSLKVGSQRANGTWRKEIKIRQGFKSIEQVPLYVIPQKRQRENHLSENKPAEQVKLGSTQQNQQIPAGHSGWSEKPSQDHNGPNAKLNPSNEFYCQENGPSRRVFDLSKQAEARPWHTDQKGHPIKHQQATQKQPPGSQFSAAPKFVYVKKEPAQQCSEGNGNLWNKKDLPSKEQLKDEEEKWIHSRDGTSENMKEAEYQRNEKRKADKINWQIDQYLSPQQKGFYPQQSYQEWNGGSYCYSKTSHKQSRTNQRSTQYYNYQHDYERELYRMNELSLE